MSPSEPPAVAASAAAAAAAVAVGLPSGQLSGLFQTEFFSVASSSALSFQTAAYNSFAAIQAPDWPNLPTIWPLVPPTPRGQEAGASAAAAAATLAEPLDVGGVSPVRQQSGGWSLGGSHPTAAVSTVPDAPLPPPSAVPTADSRSPASTGKSEVAAEASDLPPAFAHSRPTHVLGDAKTAGTPSCGVPTMQSVLAEAPSAATGLPSAKPRSFSWFVRGSALLPEWFDEDLSQVPSGGPLPPALTGGVVVDCSFACRPHELNSVLFRPGSAFRDDFAAECRLEGVQTGPWVVTKPPHVGSSLPPSLAGIQRTVSYVMPPNMLVKSVRATETMSYVRADSEGYAVDISVATPDAPFGSTFRTEMRVTIAAVQSGEGRMQSHLRVSWRPRFIQRTIMQSAIENGMRSSIQNTYFAFLQCLANSELFFPRFATPPSSPTTEASYLSASDSSVDAVLVRVTSADVIADTGCEHGQTDGGAALAAAAAPKSSSSSDSREQAAGAISCQTREGTQGGASSNPTPLTADANATGKVQESGGQQERSGFLGNSTSRSVHGIRGIPPPCCPPVMVPTLQHMRSLLCSFAVVIAAVVGLGT